MDRSCPSCPALCLTLPGLPSASSPTVLAQGQGQEHGLSPYPLSSGSFEVTRLPR